MNVKNLVSLKPLLPTCNNSTILWMSKAILQNFGSQLVFSKKSHLSFLAVHQLALHSSSNGHCNNHYADSTGHQKRTVCTVIIF